jgi:hypothetical protein
VKPIHVPHNLWRVVGATIVLAAGLGASSTVEFAVAAAEPTGRWKDLHYSSGWLGAERLDASCDFNHRLRSEGFDLWVERDRIEFTLPPVNSSFRPCPADQREITITRIAFSRGLRSNDAGVGGGDLVSATVIATANIFRAKAITRYFLSLDYREPGGDQASATFYFERQDAAALLAALSGISKVPVDVTESEAAMLGRSVNVSVSLDPHRRLLANVPLWQSQALALEGSISQIAPDGSVALANHALWELETGALRHRLARPSKRNTMRELLAGEGRWLLWAGNSGPLNGKNAMRAGEVTITDTTAVATVARVGPLPYIFNILLAPDAPLALAFVRDPHPQGGRPGWTASAIALDRGAIIWRASVPAGSLKIGRSDAARVLAFGPDWIRLWNGATGESLFDSIALLTQAEHEPIAILDAASVKENHPDLPHESGEAHRLD